MNGPQLHNLLNDLNPAHVECDGMARLVITRLAEQRIPCKAMLGRVELDGKSLSPHFWVEADGCVIDFHAHRQLGDAARLPNGVAPQAEVKARYEGQPIVIDPLPDYLFSLLKH